MRIDTVGDFWYIDPNILGDAYNILYFRKTSCIEYARCESYDYMIGMYTFLINVAYE